MKKRIGGFAAASFLLAVLATGGATVAFANTLERGPCDVTFHDDPESGVFADGSAEGTLVLKSDGSLAHFTCRGTVPDQGLYEGFHGGHTIGYLDLILGGTTLYAPVDCRVNATGTTGISLACRPANI